MLNIKVFYETIDLSFFFTFFEFLCKFHTFINLNEITATEMLRFFPLWSGGYIVAFHAADLGSIPGRFIFLFEEL